MPSEQKMKEAVLGYLTTQKPATEEKTIEAVRHLMLVGTQRELTGFIEGLQGDHRTPKQADADRVAIKMAKLITSKKFDETDVRDVLTGLMAAFEIIAASSIHDSSDGRFIDHKKFAEMLRGIFHKAGS